MLLVALAVLAGAAAGWAGRRAPGHDLRPEPRTGRGPDTDARWRGAALLGAAVLLLLVGGRWIPGDAGLALVVAGYALAAMWALANHRRPGLILVAAGLLANLAVISVDHGMPVRGLPAGVSAGRHHHGLSTRDRLSSLTDDLRLPVLAETVSPGDVLVAAGGAVMAFALVGPTRSRRRDSPPGEQEAASAGARTA